MTGLLIWLAIVGIAVFFLWKKVKATDDKLRSDRAQREASMLAQALAMRAAQEKKSKEAASGSSPQ
jgi:hypothetical protein